MRFFEPSKVGDGRVAWVVMGEEKGELKGHEHHQGALWLAKQETRKAVQDKYFKGVKVHLEPMRGSPGQAGDYCKKEGMFNEGSCLS